MIRNELEQTWAALRAEPRAEGLMVRSLPDHPSLMLGRDASNGVHLLIGDDGAIPRRQFGALSLGPSTWNDNGHELTFLDLKCSDVDLVKSFLWLVSDLIARVEGVAAPSAYVLEVLEDFKALFLRPQSMSRTDLVGLIGELEVLARLAARVPGWQAIEWWTRAEQDYCSERQRVEVKTTEHGAGGMIAVHGLEQFTSELPLALAVAECQEAGNEFTVAARIEQVVTVGVPRRELEAKVREVFDPSSPFAEQGIEVVALDWWQVNDQFPFLGPDDISRHKRAAISKLSYSVPISAFPESARVLEETVLHGF